MAACNKISMIEAFGLMNERHHDQYETRKNEIESLGYDLTGWSTVFFLNETRREVLCKFVDAEGLVRYTLMFQLSNVGRPSMGTTKKVSITLPDEAWESIDEEETTKSAFFRRVTEEYLAGGQLDAQELVKWTEQQIKALEAVQGQKDSSYLEGCLEFAMMLKKEYENGTFNK